jgi:hypothetical protein
LQVIHISENKHIFLQYMQIWCSTKVIRNADSKICSCLAICFSMKISLLKMNAFKPVACGMKANTWAMAEQDGQGCCTSCSFIWSFHPVPQGPARQEIVFWIDCLTNTCISCFIMCLIMVKVFMSVHTSELWNQTLNMEASHLDQQLHLSWLGTGFHSHIAQKCGMWQSRGRLQLPYWSHLHQVWLKNNDKNTGYLLSYLKAQYSTLTC